MTPEFGPITAQQAEAITDQQAKPITAQQVVDRASSDKLEWDDLLYCAGLIIDSYQMPEDSANFFSSKGFNNNVGIFESSGSNITRSEMEELGRQLQHLGEKAGAYSAEGSNKMAKGSAKAISLFSSSSTVTRAVAEDVSYDFLGIRLIVLTHNQDAWILCQAENNQGDDVTQLVVGEYVSYLKQRNIGNCGNIVFLGHGLGGCVAFMIASAFHASVSARSLCCITFDAPAPAETDDAAIPWFNYVLEPNAINSAGGNFADHRICLWSGFDCEHKEVKYGTIVQNYFARKSMHLQFIRNLKRFLVEPGGSAIRAGFENCYAKCSEFEKSVLEMSCNPFWEKTFFGHLSEFDRLLQHTNVKHISYKYHAMLKSHGIKTICDNIKILKEKQGGPPPKKNHEFSGMFERFFELNLNDDTALKLRLQLPVIRAILEMKEYQPLPTDDQRASYVATLSYCLCSMMRAVVGNQLGIVARESAFSETFISGVLSVTLAPIIAGAEIASFLIGYLYDVQHEARMKQLQKLFPQPLQYKTVFSAIAEYVWDSFEHYDKERFIGLGECISHTKIFMQHVWQGGDEATGVCENALQDNEYIGRARASILAEVARIRVAQPAAAGNGAGGATQQRPSIFQDVARGAGTVGRRIYEGAQGMMRVFTPNGNPARR